MDTSVYIRIINLLANEEKNFSKSHNLVHLPYQK